MRKLSSLIKGLLCCLLLNACHSGKSHESHTSTQPPADSSAVVSDNEIVLQRDTANMLQDSTSHSAHQSTDPNAPTPETPKKGKTRTKRINHGSDNPEKLDSIKQAKTKGKGDG